MHEPRVDDPPGREGADEARYANLAEIGVDLDLRVDRSVRLQRVVADGRRIARALAPSVELRQAGAGEDVGVALAAALVVLAAEPSAVRDDPDIARAVERRVAVGRGEFGEPRDGVAAGRVDRRAGGRRMAGAAGDPAVGQVGAAEAQRDLIDVEPEAVGGDLRERGQGALAHVDRARLDDGRSVAAERRPRLGGEHRAVEHGGSHAPADEEAVLVAHLPGRARPPRPAERLRAPGVAFAQRLRRIGLAGDRLDLRVIHEPEVKRVHAASLGGFVNGGLERRRPGGEARRAHGAGRADVVARGFVTNGDRRARVQHARDAGGRLDEFVEAARRRDRVMRYRGEPAVPLHAESDPLPRLAAMADRPEHLGARQHELHRPAGHPGRKAAQDMRPREDRFRAEAAADERRANEHVFRRDAEEAGIGRRAICGAWFGVSSVRRSPSHEATMACGSIALWYCEGVS